jgi:hypothetical protein
MMTAMPPPKAKTGVAQSSMVAAVTGGRSSTKSP